MTRSPTRPDRQGPTRTITVPPTKTPEYTHTDLYQHCANQARGITPPSGGHLDIPTIGRVIIDNQEGTTVVVSGNDYLWTCMLRPDLATSHAKPISSEVSSENLSIAVNAWPPAEDETATPDSQLLWGGGTLPRGSRSITFVLPNGVRVPAVTKNGFWAVQTITPTWTRIGSRSGPIRVWLSGPMKRYQITLRQIDECNQDVHGC